MKDSTVLDQFAPDGIEIARKRDRIVAFLIDSTIITLIAMVFGFFFGEPLEGELGVGMNGWPAFLVFFLWIFSVANN